MRIFLVRHGQDDESVRGGWCTHGLIEEGVVQSHQLGAALKEEVFDKMYVSDLPRTVQTAEILSSYLKTPPKMIYTADLREHNNSDLVGMDNEIAKQKYLGLYYRTVGYEEAYPNGESPHAFYLRIKKAWEDITKTSKDQNILIVTHGGVINIMMHLLKEIPYTNKKMLFPVGTGTVTKVEY